MHPRLPAVLLPALVLLAGCESAIAPQVAPEAALMVSHPPIAITVPVTVRETFAPAPDAVPIPCEPAAAGVALPSSILASGYASHLGRIHSVLTGSTCAVDLGAGQVSFTGSVVHTAANGDELHATFDGTMTLGTVALSVVFTGGTGRFESTTGSGTGAGTIDPLTMSGWFGLSGTMTRPR